MFCFILIAERLPVRVAALVYGMVLLILAVLLVE